MSHARLRRRTTNAPTLTLGVGAALLAIVIVADRLLTDRPIAAEWPPDGSVPYLARSLGLAVGSVLLTAGTWRLAAERLGPRTEPADPSAPRLVGFGGVAVAVLAALLVLVDPPTLTTLVSEDHVVEWASAGLCFVAALLVALTAFAHLRSPPETAPRSRRLGLLLVAASGVFLLLGLEEVSWFQRVLDIESPEAFVNRNGQKETNLHNFATTATGNGYYVAGFVATVAVPFVAAGRRLPDRISWLGPLIPSTAVLYAGVTAAAIVYEMWNVIWIQLTFWLSLAALAYLDRDRPDRALHFSLLAAMVITAATFLLRGDTMVRTWDDTEVRELIIPYALAVYAAEVWLRRPSRTERPAVELAS